MRNTSFKAFTANRTSRWKIRKIWKVEVSRLLEKIAFFCCFFMIFEISNFHKSGIEIIFFQFFMQFFLGSCRAMRCCIPQCFAVYMLSLRPDIVTFLKNREKRFWDLFWTSQKSLKSHTHTQKFGPKIENRRRTKVFDLSQVFCVRFSRSADHFQYTTKYSL